MVDYPTTNTTNQPDPAAEPREAARRLSARGLTPIRCRPLTKVPDFPGWQKLTPDQVDPDEMFPAGRPWNVGVRTGPLGDVDKDCPEARATCRLFLPPTSLESGRSSAPDSHSWYRLLDPLAKASEKFADPVDGAVILEVRGPGGQTIVPPSVLPPKSGGPGDPPEAVVWGKDGEPAEVTADDLLTAAGDAAAGPSGRSSKSGCGAAGPRPTGGRRDGRGVGAVALPDDPLRRPPRPGRTPGRMQRPAEAVTPSTASPPGPARWKTPGPTAPPCWPTCEATAPRPRLLGGGPGPRQGVA